MKIIHQNPFRIAGVLSNTTERELQRQKTKVKAYAKVGKEISSEYDFKILENITRTEETIDKAFSDIEQNQDKMSLALFWFLNANPFDEIAISHLKNGDSEKALGIWEKATIDKEITSKNFSCFSNISTYKLLGDYDNINQGIEVKINLIESEYFEDFALTVTDKTFIIDRRKQVELFVDELINQLEDEYSELDTFKLFKNCNGSTQNYLLDKFSAVPFQQIEKEIVKTKYKRSQNSAKAYEYGLDLYQNTQAHLIKLQSILDKGNLKYQTIADQLANEILQCGIDYYNGSIEQNATNNFLENSKLLNKIADKIAVGKLTRDRVKDSLNSLEEIVNSEVLNVINILESIINAYKNIPAGQYIDIEKVSSLLKKTFTDEVIKRISSCDDDELFHRCMKLIDFVSTKVGYTPDRLFGIGQHPSYYLLKKYYGAIKSIKLNKDKEIIKETFYSNLKNTTEESNQNLVNVIIDLLKSCYSKRGNSYKNEVLYLFLKENISDDMLVQISQCGNNMLIEEFYYIVMYINSFRIIEIETIAEFDDFIKRVDNVFIIKLPKGSKLRKDIESKMKENKIKEERNRIELEKNKIEQEERNRIEQEKNRIERLEREKEYERKKREEEIQRKKKRKFLKVKRSIKITCYILILVAMSLSLNLTKGADIPFAIAFLFGVPIFIALIKEFLKDI